VAERARVRRASLPVYTRPVRYLLHVTFSRHSLTSYSIAVTVCKWLFQSFHDVQAVANFDYVLPLMPELFRFTEVNDNDELATRASYVLVRMCGVTPPASLVNPLIDAMFTAIRKSAVSLQCQDVSCNSWVIADWIFV